MHGFMVNAWFPRGQASPDTAKRDLMGIIRSHFSKKCGSFVLNKRKKANAAFNAMR
jgi:hypothetical protein